MSSQNNAEENQELLPIIYSDKSITFAMDEEDFKDFVVKLLGKPEVISGKIDGPFEISKHKFQTINYQVNLAVSEINDSWIIEFVAELFFDDDSAIRINGIDNFLNYQEIRPIACVGFNFTWTYLVRFKQNMQPEKQEISIYSDHYESIELRDLYNDDDSTDYLSALRLWLGESDSVPRIHYSVRSTIQNWGLMVSQRVKNVLESNCFIEVSFQKLRRIIYKFMPSILVPLFFIFIISSALKAGFLDVYTQPNQELEVVRSALIEESLDDSSGPEKIDYLIKVSQYELAKEEKPKSSNSKRDNPLKAGYSFAFVAIPLLYLSTMLLVYIPNKKFILFTDKSIQLKKKYIARNKSLEILSISGIVISIILGVLSNYAFNFLTN